MRKQIVFGFMLVLFISIASAEIIMEQQPSDIYNLGDTVSIPIKIKASSDLSGSFNMDLVCDSKELNFYRNGVSLSYGEELTLSPAPSLVLTKSIIEDAIGDCKIRASLGDETSLTNQFEISKELSINLINRPSNINPGKSVVMTGEATKTNGKIVEGFLDVGIIMTLGANKTKNLDYSGSINGGEFSINISLPQDAKAGSHLLKLEAYEKDPNGETTNIGRADYTINVAQIPTSLEIILGNQLVEPGTKLEARVILRDQTGEKMNAEAILTIKDLKNKIREEIDKKTGKLFEYPIPSNQAPGKWTLYATSQKLNTKTSFNISEKEEVKVFLINKTVAVTNTGNVPYCNKTILVKIGESPVNIEPCLDVDETRKYLLTAPDGKYDIEIIQDGERIISQSLLLTGRSIEAKERRGNVFKIIRSPAAWIFIIMILGLLAVIFFRKGFKKTFIGGFKRKPSKKDMKKKSLRGRKKISLGKKKIEFPSTAELSLNMKGEKQTASAISLYLRNFKAIEGGNKSVKETFEKIERTAEENKARVYFSADYLFFILTPLKTRTFKNAKTALSLANEITSLLDNHNRIFKQEINYGIALHEGELIAKSEGRKLKFMPIKDFLTKAKKIAHHSSAKILLSEEIKTKFGGSVKTQKHSHDNVISHEIKQIIDRAEHKEFISNFLHRLEKDKEKARKK